MYKIEDNKLVKAPKFIHRNIKNKDYITTNPTTEMLKDLGYKDLKEETKPEITKYQLLKEKLTDGETIIHSWEVIDKPIIEDDIPELLEGYEYEEYEVITDSEIHRGKKLVKIPVVEEPIIEQSNVEESDEIDKSKTDEEIAEEMVEESTDSFQESINEDSDERDKETIRIGDSESY